MMMSAPASRIVPFSDLSTARLLAYGVTDRHTWVRIDAAGGKLAVWNGGGMDELLAGSGNESVAPGGARQAKAIRRRRSI